jgi:hypothetical protein
MRWPTSVCQEDCEKTRDSGATMTRKIVEVVESSESSYISMPDDREVR